MHCTVPTNYSMQFGTETAKYKLIKLIKLPNSLPLIQQLLS